MPSGKFVNLDADTLATLKTNFTACLNAIAVGHQSYSIAGRTFTRGNLAEVSDTLAEIAFAQKIADGTLQRNVRVDMSSEI